MKTRTRFTDKLDEIPCDEITLKKILAEGRVIVDVPASMYRTFQNDLNEIGYTGSYTEKKERTKQEKRSYSTQVIIPWSCLIKFSDEMAPRVKDKFNGGNRQFEISCNAFTGWLLTKGFNLNSY